MSEDEYFKARMGLLEQAVENIGIILLSEVSTYNHQRLCEMMNQWRIEIANLDRMIQEPPNE